MRMRILGRASGLVVLALLAASPVAAQKPANGAREHRLGSDPNAPVVMEVFSDHQCPACRRFYLEVTRPVLANYAMKGKVVVVYRDFPLRTHQYARQAARYSQAASRLGQEEWIRVTDAIYLYQSKWSANGDLQPVVAQALPEEKMAQVRKWLEDPQLDTNIDRDIARGRQLGVRATPTIFITANGKTERIPSGVQYAILRRYLDSLLTRAQ